MLGVDSDRGMNHMAPLNCWPKRTVRAPGESECERNRGSDSGLKGQAPQKSRDSASSPAAVRARHGERRGRTSPSMLPSNGSNGRTPARHGSPRQAGNFPSQTQGDCGTDGTFPLLRSWETKGSCFKILSPFQHVGGPEEAKASPKHWIKTSTDHRRLPRQELLDTAQP